MTAEEVAGQFEDIHALGGNAVRAFGWEGVLEQPVIRHHKLKPYRHGHVSGASRLLRISTSRLLVQPYTCSRDDQRTVAGRICWRWCSRRRVGTASGC